MTMASSTVKCVNCNIVINELLAFLRNVLGLMDEQSIHQLCTTSFTADDIVKAKSLIFESLPNAKKMPLRRKDGKKKISRDLDDIIRLMTTTEEELIPIFVAKELHKLPPVTFDHVDATRLLKDILRLQNQLSVLEKKCVTTERFDVLYQEIEDMKHASMRDNWPSSNYVNKRRGACLQNSPADSGPLDHNYVPTQTADEVNDRSKSASHSPTTRTFEERAISFSQKLKDATDTQGHAKAQAAMRASNSASENAFAPTQGQRECTAVSERHEGRTENEAAIAVSEQRGDDGDVRGAVERSPPVIDSAPGSTAAKHRATFNSNVTTCPQLIAKGMTTLEPELSSEQNTEWTLGPVSTKAERRGDERRCV